MQKSIEYENGLKTKSELLHITSYPIHVHQNDFQIAYVLDGELDFEITHTHYYLHKGSVHVIHSEDVHSIKAITPDNTVLFINISTPYYMNVFNGLDNMLFSTNFSNDSYHKTNIHELKKHLISIALEECYKSTGYQSRIHEETISLLDMLIKHFRGFTINTTAQTLEHITTYDTLQINRISNIMQYIYKNHSYKLQLSELAEQEKLSVYYLSHLFQRIVGISFRDFLSIARLEMSEYTLLSTDHSLSRIAQDAGFSSTKYYIENFIKIYGMHPKEFRKIYSEKVLGKEDANYTQLPLSDLDKYLTEDILNGSSESNNKTFKTAFIMLNDTNVYATDRINTNDENKFRISMWNNLCESIQKLTTTSPAMNSFTSRGTSTVTASELYQAHVEQNSCIKFLKSIVNTGKVLMDDIRLLDFEGNTNGILTINGMKKPLYHLLRLFNGACDSLIYSGTDYFVAAKDGKYTIFVFNESKTAELQIDFDFSHNNSDYKLTEKRLSSSKTCITMWSQLNFMDALDSEDMINIEKMSEPEISFQILTPSNHHLYTCILQPLDVTVISVKAI